MELIVAAVAFGVAAVVLLLQSTFAIRRNDDILAAIYALNFWVCIGFGIVLFTLAPIYAIYA